MMTIYKHITDTACIEAIKRRDGTTDIIMVRDIGTTQESVMQHTLPINECDRFGAALCKDIIDNYTGHNSRLKDKIADLEDEARNVRYDNATLRDEKTRLKSIIFAMHAQVCERNATISDCVVEHNQHADQLCARIEYLEAINKGLEDDTDELQAINAMHIRHGEIYRDKICRLHDERATHNDIHKGDNSIIKGLEGDVSNLRMANSLYRKRWNDRNDLESESHGMRSINFERMVKGYHGVLSRHGKTIVITLPFEHESVARNAEKYIVGLED